LFTPDASHLLFSLSIESFHYSFNPFSISLYPIIAKVLGLINCLKSDVKDKKKSEGMHDNERVTKEVTEDVYNQPFSPVMSRILKKTTSLSNCVNDTTLDPEIT
jgi:hypothetical protein